MTFKNKKVLILGMGASGTAAQKFLTKRGALVTLYDDKMPKKERTLIIARAHECEFDFCVISPGVSINHDLAKKFAARPTPAITSELALGFTARHKKIVAVTGTNGKTTLVTMLAAAIPKSVPCGNVGTPVTSVSCELRRKTAVVEASSFQLESPRDFRPNIAVITNITQDHHDRHGDMATYAACKAAIAANQRRRDILILNYDDDNCRALGRKLLDENPKRKILWSSTTARVRGIYLDGKDIVLNTRRRARIVFKLGEFNSPKPHQIYNILAAVLVCKLLRVSHKRILAACKGDGTLEHRIQFIGISGQTAFYNDSKATNIAACLAACNCFAVPVNLLVGGVPKGQNFTELFEKLPPHVAHIFAFGASASQIEHAHKIFPAAKPPLTTCADLREAAGHAAAAGTGPRVVLLSPACASFDQFNDYRDRGQKFAEIVNNLQKNSPQK